MLSAGTGMHVICTFPDMPGETTVYRWLESNIVFREKYTRARERAADRFASDVIAIADQTEDTIRSVEKARLRIDARKWAAGKFAPKKYADRMNTELTGKDGGPIQHQNVQPDLSNLSDDELANLESIAEKIAQTAGSGADKG